LNLQSLLAARVDANKPVRVGLIGAGKFGSMFLSQVPTIRGLEVAVIADLDPERAKRACQTVGWDSAHIARTHFTADGRYYVYSYNRQISELFVAEGIG